MNEKLIVILLTAFDAVMDFLTFDAWSYERGNVVPSVKVKECPMPTCFICHRPLSDPKSIERGMGDICASHNQKETDLAQREEYVDAFDNSVPFTQALVMKRKGSKGDADIDRSNVITNVPHLVAHHSPSGFEWGYAGSGPADLALNVCQLYLNLTGYEGRKTKCYDGQCWTLAWMLHQDFKDAFITFAPRNGKSIPFGEIDEWMKSHITVKLLQQCAAEPELEEEE